MNDFYFSVAFEKMVRFRLLFSCFALWPIRCFAVNRADKLRQAAVSQLLADRQVLSDMIPIMIDYPLKKVSINVGDLFTITGRMLSQFGGGERVEPGVSGGCDRMPGRQHLCERRRAGWSAICKIPVDFPQKHFTLSKVKEVSLLLPRQMPDVPTDAIHGQDAFAGVVIAHAFDRAGTHCV